ncbi:type II toxin-antitoxin system VapC family toxin, partial [Microcoleus sp. herbarium12]|uniref:type II toxin-antitoxin system VapC family toxin n=1 Tax=Microcoleus sp. herbarium12 TaxID=3055437 RepID=UPI002FD55417
VHLIFGNILVGAKHFGSKSLILTHKLCAEMLRPCQNEMHPTVITLEEQFYGRLNGIRRANSPEKLISAYAKLSATWNYFATVNLLDFDLDASNCFSKLLHQKIRIGTQDLRIAAVVMSRNAILVTRNRRDFERVPGLRFEDWTLDVSDEG